MDTFQIINLILSVIILIVFFRMGSNLSDIKQEVIDFKATAKKDIRREHNLNYQMYRVIGDKHAAYKSLIFVLMYDLTSENYGKLELKRKYEEFKTKNAEKVTKLGYPFPEYPFEE